ncbi:hypothetical protein EKO27_g4821 [Xylaria grammica]|uniref:Rhodopsin domain-containing protein n=1 Tax=Xylaria grammica TaxID=363999 RepID=A0A439D7A7_9PEZI|nr:hypothetical protein EKO27_g4821 [Xylaria grammica]
MLPLLADDWFAAIALVSWIANAICLFILVHDKNLGYSSFDFTPEETAAKARNYEVYVIASDVFSTNTIASVKLSALFLYRRIFCVGEKQTIFQTVTRITVVIVVLWLFVFQFLTGFQCGTHFAALWDGSYAEYCTLSFPFLYGLVISDFILDIWLLILPIPSISRLNAKPHRKLLIIGLFFLTFVGLGASIARIVQYVKIEQGGPDFYLYADNQRKFISAMGDRVILSADHSSVPIIGLTTQAIFYTTLECGIALVAINLPTLRVFSAHQNIGGMIRSMRSLIELPFLRRSESNISQIDLEPAITISNTRNHSSLDC